MMKKMCLFMTMISLMLLASCQQDENVETGKEDVTIAGLEKEFGITFSDEAEAGVPATFLSLEELNEFLSEFKKLEGKPIQVPETMTEALTRGPVFPGEIQAQTTIELSKNYLNLDRLIGVRVMYTYDPHNSKANGFFNTYIYFMETPDVNCYESRGRKTVYDIAYNGKEYVSLVNPDCKISFWTGAPGSKPKYTTVYFKLQVDCEKTNFRAYTMTLFRALGL